MILDTCFLLDVLKKKENAVAKVRSWEDSDEIFAVASPCIFELWTGFYALNKSENDRKKTKENLERLIVFDFDIECAKISGKIHGELIAKGQQIDPEDSMIAGIAIKNNQTILTRDSHFSRIEGLKIESY